MGFLKSLVGGLVRLLALGVVVIGFALWGEGGGWLMGSLVVAVGAALFIASSTWFPLRPLQPPPEHIARNDRHDDPGGIPG